MCGNTRAEILRAIMGNLKQHDFDVNGKFAITDEEGAVLLMALEDYKQICDEGEFYSILPKEVFNDNTVVRRGSDGKIIC